MVQERILDSDDCESNNSESPNTNTINTGIATTTSKSGGRKMSRCDNMENNNTHIHGNNEENYILSPSSSSSETRKINSPYFSPSVSPSSSSSVSASACDEEEEESSLVIVGVGVGDDENKGIITEQNLMSPTSDDLDDEHDNNHDRDNFMSEIISEKTDVKSSKMSSSKDNTKNCKENVVRLKSDGKVRLDKEEKVEVQNLSVFKCQNVKSTYKSHTQNNNNNNNNNNSENVKRRRRSSANEKTENNNNNNHHHPHSHPHPIIVPRTVPCIVLTPPALFSPGIPLLNYDSNSIHGGKSGKSGPGSGDLSLQSAATSTTSSSLSLSPAAGGFPSFQFVHHNMTNSEDEMLRTMRFKREEQNQYPGEKNNNINNNNMNGLNLTTNNNISNSTNETKTPRKSLAFGIDRILSSEEKVGHPTDESNSTNSKNTNHHHHHPHIIKNGSVSPNVKHYQHQHQNHHHNHPHHHSKHPGLQEQSQHEDSSTPPHHHQNQNQNQHHPHNNNSSSHSSQTAGAANSSYPSQCSECFFLSRYCRRIQFPITTVAPQPPSVSSFSWIPSGSGSGSTSTGHPISDNHHNSSLITTNGFGHHHAQMQSFGLNGSGSFSTMSTMVSCNTQNGGGRRKRSWSRAVFSNLQRKGLEKRFQLQKYITKPDRRQLAATLGLTDAQVKVWFQNRRMKWRHSRDGKQAESVVPVSVNSEKK